MGEAAGIGQRIVASIRQRIESGLDGPGARLPSTRALAAEWGVSRTTVTAAYEQLIAEGYLEVRQGTRARVAAGLGRGTAGAVPEATRDAKGRLSAFGRRLAALPPAPAPGMDGLVADFRYGELSARDFPLRAWRKAVTAALLRPPAILRYGDPAGSPRLRQALQGYLWRARGLRCTPSQIIIVNGSQQGIDLCARLLADPADGVAMEEPGYALARQVFEALGARVIPVPVDAEGLRTTDLPQARLAYATPSHQYPLGGVLSAARRRELLAWAGRCGAHVIEDDYDSEYRYDIAPVPPLQVMDEEGRVLYLGTVSKTLSPTLRLGWLVVPPALAETFVRAKQLADRHAPGLEQEALATLIESGAHERHIRRARRLNGERRSALLAALATHLGDAAVVEGAAAGLHVVVWLLDVRPEQEAVLVKAARAAGVGVHPVTPLHAEGVPGRVGLVMGYAGVEVAAIERGVAVLAGVLRGLR
ncbi:MocR-like pyridoxine biosynthesis transcription factor PdxR [Falsiroseomonas stagni]|uniref:GntR family transcriptional regulator / MocR family aminotransferase n=1 Tax=Falsiroseomonas stagni DSM 19981 TaxID=1123062 RepID=A0A1I4CMQ3_9PROT|nr:PLP-dependent aminotransferase family protein [Falsiroseomonas stagni]SFK82554.1 GntR family transcriptional regulator / MocR family aminotransferase [Falsiroseomonas stagni DSM 19981]